MASSPPKEVCTDDASAGGKATVTDELQAQTVAAEFGPAAATTDSIPGGEDVIGNATRRYVVREAEKLRRTESR